MYGAKAKKSGRDCPMVGFFHVLLLNLKELHEQYDDFASKMGARGLRMYCRDLDKLLASARKIQAEIHKCRDVLTGYGYEPFKDM